MLAYAMSRIKEHKIFSLDKFECKIDAKLYLEKQGSFLNLKLALVSEMWYLGLNKGFFLVWKCALRTRKLVNQVGRIAPIFCHLKDNISYMTVLS